MLLSCTVRQPMSYFSTLLWGSLKAALSHMCRRLAARKVGPEPSTSTKQQQQLPPSLGAGIAEGFRTPDSWLEGHGFESRQERRGSFQLSVLTAISTFLLIKNVHMLSYWKEKKKEKKKERKKCANAVLLKQKKYANAVRLLVFASRSTFIVL